MTIDDGSVFTQPGTAGTIDDDIVPEIYVGQHGSIVLNIGSGSYNGTLTPQGTNDPTDSGSWQTIKMTDMISLDAGDTSSAGFNSVTNRVFGCIRTYSWFRTRMTSYTSGAADGVLQLFKAGLPGFQLQKSYTRVSYGDAQLNVDNVTILASAAITADDHSADFINYSAKGVRLYIVPGVFGAGASTIKVTLEERDTVGGGYFTLLQSAALVDSTPQIIKLYPGIAASSNVAASDFLPKTWRVKWSASAWGTGGSVLGISAALNG